MISAPKRDTRSKRERIVDQLASLDREIGEVSGKLAGAADVEQAARVEALRADPGKRSTDAGAASRVYKIVESTRRDEIRLTGLEAERDAALIVLAELDAAERADAHAARVKLNDGLNRRERACLDELAATHARLLEQFAAWKATLDERVRLVGGSDSPDLAGVLVPPPRTVAEMVTTLDARGANRAPAEPASFPAAAPGGAVVPIPRTDPRWGSLARARTVA